jgi:hypothetical protein
MNERLKELMLEAGYAAPELAGRANRLAELLIAECSEVARRTILTGSGVDPDTFVGTVTTVQQIKKHFGVEE